MESISKKMKGLKIFILLFYSFSCITCLEINISDSEFDKEKVNFREVKNSPYYRKFELFPEQGFEILQVTSDEKSIWFAQPRETCSHLTVIKLKFSPVVLILDVNGTAYFFYKKMKQWSRVDFYTYSRLFDQINMDHGSYTLDLEKEYPTPLVNVEKYEQNNYFVVDFYNKLKYFIGEVKYKNDFVFNPNKMDFNENHSEDEYEKHDNINYICTFVKLSNKESYTFIEIEIESNQEQRTLYFWKGKYFWILIPENEYSNGIINSIKPTDTSQESNLNSQQLQTISQSQSSRYDNQKVPNDDIGIEYKSENFFNDKDEDDDKNSGTDSSSKSNEFHQDLEQIQDCKYTKSKSTKSGLNDQELPYLKTDLKESEKNNLIDSLERGLNDTKIKERIINRGKELGKIFLKASRRLKGSFLLDTKPASFLVVIITFLIIF